MDPQWVTKIIDLVFWGWFKAYVDVIEDITQVEEINADVVDTTLRDTHDNTDVILKTLSQLQRQVTGMANEQEKLLKVVQSMKSKWTAKN